MCHRSCRHFEDRVRIVNMDNLAHPEYMMFKQRLKSFTSWPPQLNQKKTDLAHAGLFYSNVSDRVVCFACGVMLYGWNPQDNPWLEHCKYAAGHCAYLNMVGDFGLFVPMHGDSNTHRVSNEVLDQQRITPFSLWTRGNAAGLDTPDAGNTGTSYNDSADRTDKE